MVPNDASPIPNLVLASASPARRALLESLGMSPEVYPTDIDETPHPGERPRDLVRRLSHTKCAAARAGHPPPGTGGGVGETGPIDGRPMLAPVVIAADTVADVDGEILGKPGDDDEAMRMLQALSGRSHHIHSGITVGYGEAAITEVDTTTVTFRVLSSEDIAQYVAAGEARGRAGAYGIQGRGGLFVERIEGSYPAVVGLPLHLVDACTRQLGWPLTTWIQP